MTAIRTYIDSGLLFWAYRGGPELYKRAMQILEDPNRLFVSSVFLELEVIPKATYFNRRDEIDFYQTFFDDKVKDWAGDPFRNKSKTGLLPQYLQFWRNKADSIGKIVNNSKIQASFFGLNALDALHIAAALSLEADEFVTTEKLTSPLQRVTGLKVVSIAI